jgi:hypothetical protein
MTSVERLQKLEVADIIRAHGAHYRKAHRLPLHQHKVLNDIERCRTAALGGHVDACDSCGHERISYNSCRNRHCPKCGALAKERWLLAREKDLLPVPYFHIVFTLPDMLNHLVLTNAREIYPMLFRAVAETLITLAKDPKHLGAQIGLIAVLHTWGQNLMDHPHVHCIVPGGGLSVDGKKWVASREHFFIPVKVLSRMFRGKMISFVKQAYRAGKLKCVGNSAALENKNDFQQFLDVLYAKEWIVYAKEPFGGPEQVLTYLGRYTHRVAISNNRLVSMTDGRVTFQWRDYRDAHSTKLTTVDACEFIRRFLLHVLPERMCKIRYYGLLSNRNRTKMLAQCRNLLGVLQKGVSASPKQWQELVQELTGVDVRICPKCHTGRMVLQRTLEPVRNHAP